MNAGVKLQSQLDHRHPQNHGIGNGEQGTSNALVQQMGQ